MKTPVGHPLHGPDTPYRTTQRTHQGPYESTRRPPVDPPAGYIFFPIFLFSFFFVCGWVHRWLGSRLSFVGRAFSHSLGSVQCRAVAAPYAKFPAAPPSSSASRPFAKRQDGDRQALIAPALRITLAWPASTMSTCRWNQCDQAERWKHLGSKFSLLRKKESGAEGEWPRDHAVRRPRCLPSSTCTRFGTKVFHVSKVSSPPPPPSLQQLVLEISASRSKRRENRKKSYQPFASRLNRPTGFTETYQFRPPT